MTTCLKKSNEAWPVAVYGKKVTVELRGHEIMATIRIQIKIDPLTLKRDIIVIR